VSQPTPEHAHVRRGAFGNASRMVPISVRWTGFLGAGGTRSLWAVGSLWLLHTTCVNPWTPTRWVSFLCWSLLGGGGNEEETGDLLQVDGMKLREWLCHVRSSVITLYLGAGDQDRPVVTCPRHW